MGVGKSLIILYLLLVMAIQSKVKATSFLKTHGVLLGESKATSKSVILQTMFVGCILTDLTQMESNERVYEIDN